MQVALVNDELTVTSDAQQSVIRLKKMIDSIKRIDLPTFQTELHQVCQYGGDSQLLKFYPKVLIYYLFIYNFKISKR